MDLKVTDIPEALLEPLYDTPLSSENWRLFLQRAAEIFRADAAAIIFHDPNTARTTFNPTFNFSEAMRSDFEQLTKFSLWTHEIRKYEEQGWYSGAPEDVISFDQYRASETYKDLNRKYGIQNRASGIVFGRRGSMRGLSLLRMSESSPFGAEEKRLLQSLVPHLARVFNVHRKMTSLSERYNAASRALDFIGAACITVAANRRVLSINRRAQALLANGNALRVDDGRLKTSDRSQQHVLDACIVQVCARSTAGASEAIPCATTLRSKNADLLYVSVLPYHSQIGAFEDLEDTPAALLFVTTPEEQAEGEHRLWQEMFGLTPAECRVAEMMKQGSEVSGISEVLNIRTNTVRYYQKSIYRKTGVTGHSALIRLLTRLPSSDK